MLKLFWGTIGAVVTSLAGPEAWAVAVAFQEAARASRNWSRSELELPFPRLTPKLYARIPTPTSKVSTRIVGITKRVQNPGRLPKAEGRRTGSSASNLRIEPVDCMGGWTGVCIGTVFLSGPLLSILFIISLVNFSQTLNC